MILAPSFALRLNDNRSALHVVSQPHPFLVCAESDTNSVDTGPFSESSILFLPCGIKKPEPPDLLAQKSPSSTNPNELLSALLSA